MRIAFLFSGQPIYYPECLESLPMLGKGEEDTSFAHLWWDNSYRNKVYKLHFDALAEDEQLSIKFVDQYDIDDSKVEPQKTFDLSFVKKIDYKVWGEQSVEYYRIMSALLNYGLLSQTYSTMQGCYLSQGYNFDAVVRCRSDLIYSRSIENIIKGLRLESNTIYFQSSMGGGHAYAGEGPNKPCDWFFLGNQFSMDKFCWGWHELFKEEFKDGIIHTSDYLQRVCDKLGLKVELVDFGVYIYKQVTDFYEKHLIKPEFYLEDFDHEKCQPKTPEKWPYWVENVDFKHFLDL